MSIRETREARNAQGLCADCGANPHEHKRKRCTQCLGEARQRSAINRHGELRHNVRSSDRKHFYKVRIRALMIYGGCCACCGENNYQFLTFDHVNNDGFTERHTNYKSGGHFAKSLTKGPYRFDIQILCWNCNAAKAYHGGCPHNHRED